MAKSSNQKTKLLRLSQLLLRQTDEDHPMPVAQIIEELGKYDIKAERKSIYDDLEVVNRNKQQWLERFAGIFRSVADEGGAG